MKKKAKKTGGKTAGKAPAARSEKNQKVTPLGDRVLLKAIEEKAGEQKTDSGIFLPDSAKEDRGAKKAKVVAVGEGRYEDGEIIPVRVRVGDVVLYSWGDTVTIEGQDYILVRESEISAIVRE